MSTSSCLGFTLPSTASNPMPGGRLINGNRWAAVSIVALMMFHLGNGERALPSTSRLRRRPKTPMRMRTSEETYWILKKFTVFNADQVSGAAAEQFQSVEQPDTDQHTEPDFEPAEQLIQATGADIRHGGGRAFYSLDGDFICLPPKSSFVGGAYYATALHELAHWSECRVGWDRKDNNYAMGELIAELASCFLATELGIPNTEDLDNHAAYVKSWLAAMKDDANYIFKASRQASKVCDYLLGFVKQPETETTPELVEAA